MKPRKPAKPRNLLVMALRESGKFTPKTIPAKKGKGSAYSRKGRNDDRSGPYLLLAMLRPVLFRKLSGNASLLPFAAY